MTPFSPRFSRDRLGKVDYLMRTVSVLIGIAACLAVARASTPEELVACPVSPNLRGHENIECSCRQGD